MNQKKSSKQKVSEPNFFIKHKVAFIIGSCAVMILLLPVLYIGLLGFMPGVSSVFGTDKPRDLGVRYDDSNLQEYKNKTSIVVIDSTQAPADPSNPNEKQVYANPKNANDLVLTDKEVTANINSLAQTLSWLPLEDVQVRFTNGGLEMSGMLNMEKADQFNEHVLGQSSPKVNAAISWAKHFDSKVPFYLQVNATIENSALTYKLVKAEIGRAELPLDLFSEDISAQTNTDIKATNFTIDRAQLTDGELTFSGLYPTTLYLDK